MLGNVAYWAMGNCQATMKARLLAIGLLAGCTSLASGRLAERDLEKDRLVAAMERMALDQPAEAIALLLDSLRDDPSPKTLALVRRALAKRPFARDLEGYRSGTAIFISDGEGGSQLLGNFTEVENSLSVLDPETGVVVDEFDVGVAASRMQVSADGQVIWASSDQAGSSVLDRRDGRLITGLPSVRAWRHQGEYSGAMLSPSGRWLVWHDEPDVVVVDIERRRAAVLAFGTKMGGYIGFEGDQERLILFRHTGGSLRLALDDAQEWMKVAGLSSRA